MIDTEEELTKNEEIKMDIPREPEVDELLKSGTLVPI